MGIFDWIVRNSAIYRGLETSYEELQRRAKEREGRLRELDLQASTLEQDLRNATTENNALKADNARLSAQQADIEKAREDIEKGREMLDRETLRVDTMMKGLRTIAQKYAGLEQQIKEQFTLMLHGQTELKKINGLFPKEFENLWDDLEAEAAAREKAESRLLALGQNYVCTALEFLAASNKKFRRVPLAIYNSSECLVYESDNFAKYIEGHGLIRGDLLNIEVDRVDRIGQLEIQVKSHDIPSVFEGKSIILIGLPKISRKESRRYDHAREVATRDAEQATTHIERYIQEMARAAA